MGLQLTFQVIILRDSVHEDHFRLSKDLITQRVWEERIKPYIDDPVYRVRASKNITFIFNQNILYHQHRIHSKNI